MFPLNDGEDYLTFIILLSGQHFLTKNFFMKKLLIGTIVALLCIIAIQASNQNETGTVLKSSPFVLQDTCLTKFCSTIEPGHFTGNISFDLATKMSRAYNSSPGKNMVWNGSQISRIEDASTVVFDLATLKNYIAYVETNVCKRGCNRKDLQLGVRFYYAQYPSEKAMELDPQLRMVNPAFANKHTLFMVPVYRFTTEKGIFKNFNPLAVVGCNFPWNTGGVPAPPWLLTGGTEPEEENHGSLRPPPAGTGIGVFPEN